LPKYQYPRTIPINPAHHERRDEWPKVSQVSQIPERVFHIVRSKRGTSNYDRPAESLSPEPFAEARCSLRQGDPGGDRLTELGKSIHDNVIERSSRAPNPSAQHTNSQNDQAAHLSSRFRPSWSKWRSRVTSRRHVTKPRQNPREPAAKIKTLIQRSELSSWNGMFHAF
jgi:hypothetical protein